MTDMIYEKSKAINQRKDQHMEKGKATIPVKLEKLTDLYMKHDFKQMELSDEICDYIAL